MKVLLPLLGIVTAIHQDLGLLAARKGSNIVGDHAWNSEGK